MRFAAHSRTERVAADPAAGNADAFPHRFTNCLAFCGPNFERKRILQPGGLAVGRRVRFSVGRGIAFSFCVARRFAYTDTDH